MEIYLFIFEKKKRNSETPLNTVVFRSHSLSLLARDLRHPNPRFSLHYDAPIPFPTPPSHPIPSRRSYPAAVFLLVGGAH